MCTFLVFTFVSSMAVGWVRLFNRTLVRQKTVLM